MSNPWLHNIRHVGPGEPVDAGVVSRPDRGLEQRTEYLRERLDAAELGRALFDLNATVSPDLLEGEPVYWNAEAQRYERARAAVESDPTTGLLVVQPSSDCVGLVYRKKSVDLADIVLYGIVKLPALSNAVRGPLLPGRYYVSADEAGKLTQQKPPITVLACHVQGVKDNCDDNPWVVVIPQVRDFLEDHIHYRFELVTTAAGVDTVVDGKHVITSPDVTARGWLPANHPVFNGRAPAGAKFGYNLSADAGISRVWPPMPIQAVAMLWDRGEDAVGAQEIPLGDKGVAVCDLNGIWWLSDCEFDVPWVRDLTYVSSSESSESLSVPCPREERMRVIVVYLRMLFGNDRSVVTSLAPGEGSPITVTNCDGLPAKTGDLTLGLDLEFLIDPNEAYGPLVFKELVEGFKFRRGYVAEGLIKGEGPITLDGSRTRSLTTAEKTALGLPANDTSTVHQGLITVSYDDQLVERELSPQIIRLSDTVERLYKDIPYLGFPAAQESLVRVRFNVPAANLGSVLQMQIRVQLFGRASTSLSTVLPDMYMSKRRLVRPGGTGVLLPVADDPEILFDPSTLGAVTGDTAVEITSAPFTVQEGDTVLVTLRREADDGYPAEIGMLRITGVITIPAT
jgi:hypothetical protein